MDGLLSFFKEMDLAAMLPDAEAFASRFRLSMALVTILGPILILGLGAWYFFLPRQKVGDALGFRGLIRVNSSAQWDYMQRLAGLGFGGLGIALVVVCGTLCLFYGAMSPSTAASCTLVCVIIEMILTLVLWGGIQILTQRKFSR